MVSESGGGQLTQAYNGSQKLGSSFAKSINCGLSDVTLARRLDPSTANFFPIDCLHQI